MKNNFKLKARESEGQPLILKKRQGKIEEVPKEPFLFHTSLALILS